MTSSVRRVGRMAGAMGLAVLLFASSAAGGAAAQERTATTHWPGEGRVLVGPRVAWALDGGTRTTKLAPSPLPPGVSVRFLTASRRSAGYVVDVAFAEKPFTQLTTFLDRPHEHTVAVVLVPPRGDPRRVVLLPDGSGALQRRRSGDYVTEQAIEPRLDDDTVRLPVPAAARVGPDWEVRAEVELRDQGGSGWYHVTASARLGDLTGETGAGRIGAPRRGIAVEGGVPVAARPVTLPGPARPTGMTVSVRGGRVVARVRFAEEPVPVARIEGQRVVVQVLNVLVADDVDDAFGPLVWSYDVIAGRGTVIDSRELSTAGQRPATVDVDGEEIVFDLGPASGSTAEADESPFRLASALRFTMTVLDGANSGAELGTPYVEGTVLLATPTAPGAGAEESDTGWVPLAALAAVVLAVAGGVVVGRRRQGCRPTERALRRAERAVAQATAAVTRAYAGATAPAEAALAAAPPDDLDARRAAAAELRAARTRAWDAVAPALATLARARDERRGAELALATCREPATDEAAPRQEPADDAPVDWPASS